MTLFLLQNTKEDILYYVLSIHTMQINCKQNCLITNILQKYFFLCSTEGSQMGLQKHEGEQMMYYSFNCTEMVH